MICKKIIFSLLLINNNYINSFQIKKKITKSKITLKATRNQHMKTIDVNLHDSSYNIHIGDNILSNSNILNKYINQKSKILVITNSKISPIHLNNTIKNIKSNHIENLILPDGEKEKNLDNVIEIINFALSKNMDRSSIFIALGGGVIGDIVGFAASIYMRGISFIQIPTTLMAMVDSSVGGKTGINHKLGKNLIGTFYQPKTVIIDTKFLQTLPNREYYSGLSEIIKYGIIKDDLFFYWLEKNIDKITNRNYTVLEEAIESSCKCKSFIIQKDEKENNVRAILNLGHTFGHALEKTLGYGKLLHGEAVSIGIIMAADLSLNMKLINEEHFKKIRNILKNSKLPISILDCNINYNDYVNTIYLDKKMKDENLFLILPNEKIGKCIITSSYDKELFHSIIKKYIINS